MFSKVLIKLVDQAIIPAILLLVSRVGSVLFFARYFGVPMSVDQTGFVFENEIDYILVNSYSVLLMVAILMLGVTYVLTKSLVLHDTHITPSLTAKLFSLRLSTFIQSSFDLYSQGTVWLSYSFLMLFVSAGMAFFGIIYSWVFYVSLIFTIVSTVLFILDVENEMEIKSGAFDDTIDEVEDFVLKLGGNNE
jgi:TRAP-type C4-dicarboxylate transport system permease small subunit